MTIPKGNVWIGLVELSGPPSSPILAGCTGAFSTYLTICDGLAAFENSARASADELGLALERIDWAEPYDQRIRRHEIEDYLREIADLVKRDGGGAFGKFHAWNDTQ